MTALASRIRECPGCGLFQQTPPTLRRGMALCPRCGTALHRHKEDPQGRALALALTGLLLFCLAASMTFLTLDLKGREQTTWLISGPLELESFGMWELAIPVLTFTVLAPLLKLLALTYVLIGLRLPRFRHPEVVVAEVGRQVRLIVAGKERPGLADVRPLGETLAPPDVIFRNRMKLRQIERHQPGTAIAHGSALWPSIVVRVTPAREVAPLDKFWLDDVHRKCLILLGQGLPPV